jgi:hypothetical protein
MGDESQTLLLPLFHHDIYVRGRWGPKYIVRGALDLGLVEVRQMGLEEVEKETARLVEGGWEEVGEQIDDL